MKPLSIRRLLPIDVPFVTAMIRNSFSVKLWPFMTYTQSGAADYLAVSQRFPGATPATESFVVTEEGAEDVLGFADFRLIGEGAAHLSNICVSLEARNKGLASRLIANFIDRHPELDRMQLDVFADNSSARSLYDKLGFREAGKSAWITRDLPPPIGAQPIDNLAFALAAHHVYGFCDLQVPVNGIVKKFGMMGDSVIRVFSASDFSDDSTLAGLRAIFSTPSVAFSIVPENELATVSVEHDIINKSVHMTLEIDRKSISSRSDCK